MVKVKNDYCAIILLAGIGKRIKKFSTKPKCLLKIRDKTIIDEIILSLINLRIKEVYAVIGYKSFEIKKYLKKYEKSIELKFIFNKNYSTYGSSFSWISAEKEWLKKKKNILMLHGDIVFDEKLLLNIFNDKNKDVIGTVKKKFNLIKKSGFVVDKTNKNTIKSINHKKFYKKKIFNEIACINKFSIETQIEIFKFMKKYFKKVSKKHTWEYVINDYITSENKILYTNKSKFYYWHNVNTKQDYLNLI